jgi:hypothetical protein
MSTTLRSIPATVCPDGSVTLSELLALSEPVAAMVTIVLEDDGRTDEPALLSEDALGDWTRKEEDEAWSYLEEVI